MGGKTRVDRRQWRRQLNKKTNKHKKKKKKKKKKSSVDRLIIGENEERGKEGHMDC